LPATAAPIHLVRRKELNPRADCMSLARDPENFEDGKQIAQIWKNGVRSCGAQGGGVVAAGRHCQRSGATSHSHLDVERRVSDHYDVVGSRRDSCESFDPLHRLNEEGIPVRGVVAERTTSEVVPQIEVFELDARTRFEVAREQGEADVVTGNKSLEQSADAGQYAFAGCRLLNLTSEMGQIRVAKTLQRGVIRCHAMACGQLGQDPLIGAAGHRNAPEPVELEHLLEGVRQRASTCTAGQHEGAVDIEEEDQPSPRTLPALGPFAEGSSSKLTLCPSFSWSKLP
jgi:hypothetical protein